QRQLRVGEQIRHILASTMLRGHFQNPALQDAGHITVTEVRASPDLKNATAYVMMLGGGEMDEIIKALNAEAHLFQKDIAQQANVKFTPRMRFVKDESFENAARIENLLRGLHTSDEKE